MYLFFFKFFSHISYYRILSRVPVLPSRIYFKDSSDSAGFHEALHVILTCGQLMCEDGVMLTHTVKRPAFYWLFTRTPDPKAKPCHPSCFWASSHTCYSFLPGQAASSSRPTVSPPFLASSPVSAAARLLRSRCPHQHCSFWEQFPKSASGVLRGRGDWWGSNPSPTLPASGPSKGLPASQHLEAFVPTLNLAARSSKHCHHTNDILFLKRKNYKFKICTSSVFQSFSLKL